MQIGVNKLFCNKQEEIALIINNTEPYATSFYKKYDRLVWDIASKWYKTLNSLSKGTYELEDIHNELWAYVYKKLSTFDVNRGAKLSSWIYMICDSKAGMIKRSLETKKNNIVANETNYSLNASTTIVNENDKATELLDLIGKDCNIDENIAYQEFLLDFIYSLLELIDACTDKERKVYLLKIKGKSQNEIAEEAGVSKSYIPKVFKRLSAKFKILYESLNEQSYIDKAERDALSKDLLDKKSIQYICDKYNLEYETVGICKEMLEIIGVHQ